MDRVDDGMTLYSFDDSATAIDDANEALAALLAAHAIDPEVAEEAEIEIVTRADGLHEGLEWLAHEREGLDSNLLPAVIFWHHQLDDRPVPQARRRRFPAPGGGGGETWELDGIPRYIFPEGAGSIISLHPRMDERHDDGHGRTLLVQEGTMQALAATSYAAEDVVVVGIQGCWGWSAGGGTSLLHPDLVEILTSPRAGYQEVIISLDADRSKVQSIHDAGTKLAEQIGLLGIPVRYASVPGSGNVGMDDWLASLPEASRATALATLLRDAKKSAGRRPSQATETAHRQEMAEQTGAGLANRSGRRKSAATLEIRPEEGRTMIAAAEWDERPAHIAAMDAAAVITTTWITVDDLAPDSTPMVTHDLDVSLGDGAGSIVTMAVTGVRDSDLERPRTWLRRVPGGTRVAIASGAGMASEIGSSIRAFSAGADERIRLARTGLAIHDGQAVYVHSGGALTADGQSDSISAALDEDASCIAFADIGDITEAEAMSVARLPNLMVDGTAMVAALSANALAVQGISPAAALYLSGAHGSGKTWVMQTALSAWSPLLAPSTGRRMATADGTAAALGGAGRGLHHGVVGVDDFRHQASPRKMESMLEGLDELVGRSYAGADSARRRASIDPDSDQIIARARDRSSPMAVITGEQIYGQASRLERMLHVIVDPATSWVHGGAGDADRIALGGGPQAVLAEVIRGVLRSAAPVGDETPEAGLARATAATAAERAAWATSLDGLSDYRAGVLRGTTPRVREVLAGFILGWRRWMDALERLAGDDYQDELADIRQDGLDRLADAMAHHAEREFADSAATTEPGQAMLDQIRAAVSSGRAAIYSESTMYDRSGCFIGVWTRHQGEQVLALIPSATAKAVNLSTATVRRELADVAVWIETTRRDGSTERSMTYPVTVRGARTRCWLIPADAWGDMVEDAWTGEVVDGKIDVSYGPRAIEPPEPDFPPDSHYD